MVRLLIVLYTVLVFASTRNPTLFTPWPIVRLKFAPSPAVPLLLIWKPQSPKKAILYEAVEPLPFNAIDL